MCVYLYSICVFAASVYVHVCLLAVVCREVQYIVLQNIATMSIQRKVSAHGEQRDESVLG